MEENPLLDLVSSFLGPSDTSPPVDDGISSVEPAAAAAATTRDGVSEHDYIESRKKGDPVPCHATVVVFSKDRPWQLQQLLLSMKLRRRPSAATSSACTDEDKLGSQITINIVIIARVEELFAPGYQAVEAEFGGAHDFGQVTFLREDTESEESNFQHLLERSIIMYDTTANNSGGGDEQRDDSLVMFLTDDCLLLEPIDTILSCAASCLSKEPRTLAFITRLHPAITWCQTRDVPCPPPRDQMQYVAHQYLCGDTDMGAYIFDRKVGVADWSYPFDLSGGVYRRSGVAAILDWILCEAESSERMNENKRGGERQQLSYSHPNRLEISGNIAISEAEKTNRAQKLARIVGRCTLNAAPTRPLLAILAINRVQDVCSAPLALKDGDDDHEPAALLKLLEEGKDLDIDAYRSSHFNSSHVGDLLFVDDGVAVPKLHSKSAISVLIPVHKGPPRYAGHAIKSVLMQPVEEWEEKGCPSQDSKDNTLLLSPMQIVLVDDRCADGSIDEMIRVAMEIGDRNPIVFVTIQDRRATATNGDELVNTKLSSDAKSIEISIDIVASQKNGIAPALNYGLGFCNSDIVARMDADDVSCPRRLLLEVRALRHRPDLCVVGTSSLLFRERPGGGEKVLPYADPSPDEMTSIDILRASLPASDPGVVAWAMLFSCCLSHPSVVFRKAAIEGIGGYDESISRAEDYHLWARLLQQDSRSIASLPNIGLFHRKHSSSSTSGENAVLQTDEGNMISLRSMQAITFDTAVESGADLTTVATLKRPDNAACSDDLDMAAEYLVELESKFLQKHSETLTKREIGLVRLDCDSRIGELATVCVRKFGRRVASGRSDGGKRAWDIWCNRCPDKNLERISLFCHATP